MAATGAFAGLPEEAAPAVRPQRLLGVGTSNLLLALLPAPLARLLTLAGFGRPSEARGLRLHARGLLAPLPLLALLGLALRVVVELDQVRRARLLEPLQDLLPATERE